VCTSTKVRGKQPQLHDDSILFDVISISCETSGEELDGRDDESCGGAFESSIEVPGESAVSVEPSQRAFDDPAAGQEFKAFGVIGALDDLHRPFADFCERGAVLSAESLGSRATS
jgi:hypothetical protein